MRKPRAKSAYNRKTALKNALADEIFLENCRKAGTFPSSHKPSDRLPLIAGYGAASADARKYGLYLLEKGAAANDLASA